MANNTVLSLLEVSTVPVEPNLSPLPITGDAYNISRRSYFYKIVNTSSSLASTNLMLQIVPFNPAASVFLTQWQFVRCADGYTLDLLEGGTFSQVDETSLMVVLANYTLKLDLAVKAPNDIATTTYSVDVAWNC